MIRMSVDFPAPFSPSSAWTSPARTSKLTPFSAGNPAKDLAMPCSSTMLVTRRPPCQIGPPALRGKAVTTDDALQRTRPKSPYAPPGAGQRTPLVPAPSDAGFLGKRLLGEAQEVDRLVYPGSGVDMVGARDACVGAWMASLLTRPGASPADHVSWAAAAATVSCAHVGACAPTREEVDSVCAGTSSPRAGAAGR